MQDAAESLSLQHIAGQRRHALTVYFAVESLSDESLPYLELVYDIQSEDGETYNIKFEPYQFDMANKAIQNKFILKDIFDGVDLKTANMIGEMAYAFAEYVSAILYALSDENNSSRYLKQ